MTKNSFGRLDYWKYNDGWHNTVPLLRKQPNVPYEFDSNFVGWSCWAYPADDDEFESFVATLPSAQATFRFNGGNVMFTVFIKDKNDAAAFAEKFGQYLV